MEIQHVNIKMFVQDKLQADLDRIIKVFHRWTAEQSLSELLIDVADYLHVPDGPGVVLVGHEADYAIDNAQGRWGLLYNRKSTVEGDNKQRLRQAFDAAAHACQLLEAEFPGGEFRFSRHEFQIIVNDRSCAPNTADSFSSLQADLNGFLQEISGEDGFELSQDPEPRRRFTVNVNTSKPIDLAVTG